VTDAFLLGLRLQLLFTKVISLWYCGEGTVDLLTQIVLAEFLIWAPVGICHARSAKIITVDLKSEFFY